MARLELGLDHAGLALKDLERGRAAYEKLGFTLSPRSVHAGALTPGGPVVPWGSGNHCAMFGRGYFELIGLIDEQLPSSVKNLVARYQGLHIVALDCESADQAYAALREAGVAAAEPAALERDAAYGPDNAQVRRARFRNIHLDGQAYPEARWIVIEHCTRDVLWQPHLTEHPNGVQGLAAVYFAADDPQASARRLARLAGEPRRVGQAYHFALRRGALWLMDPDQMRQAVPVLADEPVHRVAAACFEVRSLAHLQAYLDGQGVPHSARPCLDSGRPSVWVGPRHACHAALQFIESPSS
ncbi:VOC family protein [Orrella sp. JC864]|uniref:VOC family protein n=1 Tax=Orrella sp. JC864 TaxID=3120298 RepID=UPI0012BBB45D